MEVKLTLTFDQWLILTETAFNKLANSRKPEERKVAMILNKMDQGLRPHEKFNVTFEVK